MNIYVWYCTWHNVVGIERSVVHVAVLNVRGVDAQHAGCTVPQQSGPVGGCGPPQHVFEQFVG